MRWADETRANALQHNLIDCFPLWHFTLMFLMLTFCKVCHLIGLTSTPIRRPPLQCPATAAHGACAPHISPPPRHLTHANVSQRCGVTHICKAMSCVCAQGAYARHACLSSTPQTLPHSPFTTVACIQQQTTPTNVTMRIARNQCCPCTVKLDEIPHATFLKSNQIDYIPFCHCSSCSQCSPSALIRIRSNS